MDVLLRHLISLMITSMIFFPEKIFYEKPEDYGYAYEDVEVTTADGITLFGWHLQAKGKERGALLFFHGNAGNISNRLFKVKGWVDRGFSVFLIDYRGYGKSQGEIRHGDDVIKDAEAALKWLVEVRRVPLGKVILYGESLGTHPAIRLGSEKKAAAVILEAPFTSFYELAKVHYPFVPKILIREFEFPNLRSIDKLKAPVFILHGDHDEICPYAMSGELFEHAPQPKGFLTVQGGGHNDLPMQAGDDYWQKPLDFLSKNTEL